MTGVRVLYVDVDGTLVGPGGDLLSDGTTVVDGLLRARGNGIDVVPVTGRDRIQVRELCRLLGFPRGIAELGCVHVEGLDTRYELGAFPFDGETPVAAMHRTGAVACAEALGLEPHDPWNEGRVATVILRGRVAVEKADRALDAAGFGWCGLVDNGPLPRRLPQHGYHLIPAGTGKVNGVAIDRARHGIGREAAAYVGDGAGDLACAGEVGQCWLVANADPDLDWPHRTTGAYGAGVAEVIDRLIEG